MSRAWAFSELGVLDEQPTSTWLMTFHPGQVRYLWVNNYAVDMFSKENKEQFIRTDLMADASEASRAMQTVIYEKVQLGHETMNMVKDVHPDGQLPIRTRMQIAPFRLRREDATETCVAMVTAVEMEQEDKKQDEDLVRSHHMLSHTEAVMILFGTDGRIMYANPSAVAYYMLSDGAGTLNDFVESCVWHEDDVSKEEFVSCFLAVRAGDNNLAFEAEKQGTCLLADGEYGPRWHLVRVIPHKDISTGEDVILMTEVDISEQKQLLEKLHQAQLSQETFFASISHELRTPLNGIIGMSEVLHADPLCPETMKSTLKIIQQSGSRLAGLVNDILDVASLREQKMTIMHESFCISEVAATVCGTMQPLVREGVELINKIQDSVMKVQGDSSRMAQILTNLIGNAMKFTHEGSITLSAHFTTEDRYVIKVVDTGIGIPRDKKEVVFLPFTQVDAATSRKYGGTGLGLSLVKHLVAAHNGHILVESLTEEEAMEKALEDGVDVSSLRIGTTVVVTMPVEQPVPEDRFDRTESEESSAQSSRKMSGISSIAVNIRARKKDRGGSNRASSTAESSSSSTSTAGGPTSASESSTMNPIAKRFVPPSPTSEVALLRKSLVEREDQIKELRKQVKSLKGTEKAALDQADLAQKQLKELAAELAEQKRKTKIATTALHELKTQLKEEKRNSHANSVKSGSFHGFSREEDEAPFISLSAAIQKAQGTHPSPVKQLVAADFRRKSWEEGGGSFSSVLSREGSQGTGTLSLDADSERQIAAMARHHSFSKQLTMYEKQQDFGLENDKVTILTVDDEEVNNLVITGILSPEGYKVASASSGKQAIAFIQNAACLPDIVLLDVMMPHMNGLDVCKLLREEYPTLVIIMCSAKGSREDIIKGFEAGANDYVTKPVHSQELRARIRAHLQSAQLWNVRSSAMTSDSLLRRMLPAHVIEKIKLRSDGRAIVDHHKSMSVLFSDIVSFTTMCASARTEDVIVMLNDLFNAFDNLCDKHGITKCEVIGDGYMAVCGHQEGSSEHAAHMMAFALDMIRTTKTIRHPLNPETNIQIRVGIHSGSLFSGVVGEKLPKWSLFGDTVNTASRMESNGLADNVFISKSTRRLLQYSDYDFVAVPSRKIKGKGEMETWAVKHEAVAWQDVEAMVAAMSTPTIERSESEGGLPLPPSGLSTGPRRSSSLGVVQSSADDVGGGGLLTHENSLGSNNSARTLGPPPSPSNSKDEQDCDTVQALATGETPPPDPQSPPRHRSYYRSATGEMSSFDADSVGELECKKCIVTMGALSRMKIKLDRTNRMHKREREAREQEAARERDARAAQLEALRMENAEVEDELDEAMKMAFLLYSDYTSTQRRGGSSSAGVSSTGEDGFSAVDEERLKKWLEKLSVSVESDL